MASRNKGGEIAFIFKSEVHENEPRGNRNILA